VRLRAAWLVTAPLALAGVEVAHATANRLVGAPASELFESAESGRGALGLVVALLSAVVLGALAGRVLGLWSESARGRVVAAPFALPPPVAFVLLEAGEAIADGGAVGWHWLTAPVFAVGLALQLPVAVAAYALARLLLRLSDGIRRLVVRHAPPRPRRPPAAVSITLREDVRHCVACVRASRGRAPPLSAPAPS
jgi:hypothetical protein